MIYICCFTIYSTQKYTFLVLLPLKYLFGYQHALLFSGVAVANISFILAAGALYK